jgi:hypothetical protein
VLYGRDSISISDVKDAIYVAMVRTLDLELEQLDMKTAFLHENLEEWIYMSQPEGFLDSKKEDYLCLLKKSLYRLKQFPRHWYKKFNTFIIFHEFFLNPFDNSVYSKKLPNVSFVYLLRFVDDMLIVAQNKVEIDGLKTLLSSKFKMKDLGTIKKVLGMEIWRDKRARLLCVSQKKHNKKLL